MKVAIGADHGGFDAKEKLVTYLKNKGYAVADMGTNSSESVDYPDFSEKVCQEILQQKADFGVLICGTGIGIIVIVPHCLLYGIHYLFLDDSPVHKGQTVVFYRIVKVGGDAVAYDEAFSFFPDVKHDILNCVFCIADFSVTAGESAQLCIITSEQGVIRRAVSALDTFYQDIVFGNVESFHRTVNLH